MDTFLNFVGKKLNAERPHLPSNINYTLRFKKNKTSFASLWFKTKGCRYSLSGGCTMCDYFISDDISEKDMFSFFLEGIKQLPEVPDLMVIMTSGSFFDPEEVPPSVRVMIYDYLREKLPDTIIVFETHAATINEEVIDECLSYFSPDKIQIEIGIETSDEWIRKYCINKTISNVQLEKTINMLNNKNIAVIANFVVGIPFLTLRENRENVVNSIMWGIKNGIMKISLFPINIKPYTLVNWLYINKMYKQPSLWLLVDIISQIRPVFLPRIDINWYQKRAALENPLYDSHIKGPNTCEDCYDSIILRLNEYFLGDIERKEILKKMNKIECSCRDEYIKECALPNNDNLQNRVRNYYKQIDNMLLDGYWGKTNQNYL